MEHENLDVDSESVDDETKKRRMARERKKDYEKGYSGRTVLERGGNKVLNHSKRLRLERWRRCTYKKCKRRVVAGLQLPRRRAHGVAGVRCRMAFQSLMGFHSSP